MTSKTTATQIRTYLEQRPSPTTDIRPPSMQIGVEWSSREDCTALQVEGAQERGERVLIRFQGRQLEGWRFWGYVYSADPRPFRVQVLGTCGGAA